MTEKYIMKENSIPDGILHDQNLCDISLQNNDLILTFETHYYPQDYIDTTFAEKYKDFTKCHIKCTLGDRFFCNAILATALDKKDNFKGKCLSIENFVEITKKELCKKNIIQYLHTHVSPGMRSASIELCIWIKYKRVIYGTCTLELDTEELEFIWE